MKPADRSTRPGGRARAVLAAGVVLGCAAGGVLAYRLMHPPSSLSVAPAPRVGRAADLQPPAGNAAPPAAESPAERSIPEAVPDLVLPGLDGKPHRLAEWRGRPLLVNFWASWCEPCRREIPLLKVLRRERAADGLEVVGIAIDFRDAAQKYAQATRIDYPVLVGEDAGYEALAAFGMEAVLPFSAFADAKGRIVTLKVGERHPDEAALILDRMRELAQGRLTLQAAREQISSGISRLGTQRSTRGDVAAH